MNNLIMSLEFWIIAFFTVVVLLILMLIIFILIKMKTNAFVELKAFFKKTPVSLFFEDGKFLDMKATPIEAGIVRDKDYGAFIPNQRNAYLGKKTRNIYHVYDTGFAPGISIKSAQSAEVLREISGSGAVYSDIQLALAQGKLNDERIDCIRSSINTSYIKDLVNFIEPHAINASIEKKVAKQVNKLGSKGNLDMLWVFLIGLGGVVCGFLLLNMFKA